MSSCPISLEEVGYGNLKKYKKSECSSDELYNRGIPELISKLREKGLLVELERDNETHLYSVRVHKEGADSMFLNAIAKKFTTRRNASIHSIAEMYASAMRNISICTCDENGLISAQYDDAFKEELKKKLDEVCLALEIEFSKKGKTSSGIEQLVKRAKMCLDPYVELMRMIDSDVYFYEGSIVFYVK